MEKKNSSSKREWVHILIWPKYCETKEQHTHLKVAGDSGFLLSPIALNVSCFHHSTHWLYLNPCSKELCRVQTSPGLLSDASCYLHSKKNWYDPHCNSTFCEIPKFSGRFLQIPNGMKVFMLYLHAISVPYHVHADMKLIFFYEYPQVSSFIQAQSSLQQSFW